MDQVTWQPPPLWTVPREWVGERCFILCSGESIGPQKKLIKQLKGRVIAVKHGVLLRPHADVLFLSGERTETISRAIVPLYQGPYIVVRGWRPSDDQWARTVPNFLTRLKRLTRTKDHEHLSPFQTHVGGYDSGTSAIHLAHLFGATEIVMLGYDMHGGHFCPHPMQHPPADHFRRHMGPLASLAADAKAKGIRIVNCSPISRVDCFERRPLEDFL